MDWFHCNSCYTRVQEDSEVQRFFITNCGHIFCHTCAESMAASGKCAQCSQACKMLRINGELPSDVAVFLRNAAHHGRLGLTALKDAMLHFTNCTQATEFQQGQRDHFYAHLLCQVRETGNDVRTEQPVSSAPEGDQVVLSSTCKSFCLCVGFCFQKSRASSNLPVTKEEFQKLQQERQKDAQTIARLQRELQQVTTTIQKRNDPGQHRAVQEKARANQGEVHRHQNLPHSRDTKGWNNNGGPSPNGSGQGSNRSKESSGARQGRAEDTPPARNLQASRMEGPSRMAVNPSRQSNHVSVAARRHGTGQIEIASGRTVAFQLPLGSAKTQVSGATYTSSRLVTGPTYQLLELAAMEGYKTEFIEYVDPSSIVAPASMEVMPSPPSKYAVVFLVEATGKLHRHMDMLKTNYIAPILNYFRNINSTDGEAANLILTKDAWYGFVFYYSADAQIGDETWCGAEPTDNEEAALQWFDHVPMERAPFFLAYECCLLEALSSGVRYINKLVANNLKGYQVEKHFIVVSQSAPYEDALMTTPFPPQTLHEAPAFLLQNDIHFSAVCVRPDRHLREIFNSTRHLSTFAETSSNMEKHHLVLLNNINIRPVSEETPPGSVPSDGAFMSPLVVNPDGTTLPLSIESRMPPKSSPAPLKTEGGMLTELWKSVTNVPTPEQITKSPMTGEVFSPRTTGTPQESVMATPDASGLFKTESPRPPSVPQNRASPMLAANTPITTMDQMFASPAAPQKYSPAAPAAVTPTHATARNASTAANRPPSVPVSMIADAMRSHVIPRPPFTDMRGVGGSLMPQNMAAMGPSPAAGLQSGAGFGTGRVVGDRCIVWDGIVEWNNFREGSVNNRPAPGALVQQLCEIWVPANEIIKLERWPQKLTLQFLPHNFKQLIQTVVDAPIRISFNFKGNPTGEPSTAVRELHEYMVNRQPQSFGCVLFGNTGGTANPHVVAMLNKSEPTTLELRAIVFCFNQNTGSFQGLIPRDQVGFIDSMRQMIQLQPGAQQRAQQKAQNQNSLLQAQQLQQQQQQQQQQQLLQAQQQASLQRQQNLQSSQQFNMGGGLIGMDGNYGGMQAQQTQQAQMGSMGMGYQHGGNVGQQQLTQEQRLRLQHQQQQQMLYMQQQQAQQQQQQQISQIQDPQLRQLLQNSSPGLHSTMHFEK